MNFIKGNRSAAGLLFLIGILFYAYQYVLRSSIGLMSEHIRINLNATASAYSTFGSYYLLFYSLFQIPAGICLDKFAFKRVFTIGVLLCIIGTYVFVFATKVYTAQIGRIIIAFGSSTAYIGTLHIIARNFSPKYHSNMIGVMLAGGVVGTFFIGISINKYIETVGYQHILLYTTLIGGVILLMILCYITPKEDKMIEPGERFDFGTFKKLLKIKYVYVYGLLSACAYGFIAVFGDLWGKPFLMHVYGISFDMATYCIIIVAFGFMVGNIVLPLLPSKNPNLLILSALSIVLLCFSILRFKLVDSLTVIMFLLFITAMCSATVTLCFSAVLTLTPKQYVASVSGIVNMINMLSVGIIQQAFGWRLDALWDNTVDAHGIRMYTAEQYMSSGDVFLLALLCIIPLGIFSFKVKKYKLD